MPGVACELVAVDADRDDRDRHAALPERATSVGQAPIGAFLSVLRALPRFDLGRPLRPWLHRIGPVARAREPDGAGTCRCSCRCSSSRAREPMRARMESPLRALVVAS